VDDERTEVVFANSTQTLLTRFVTSSNWTKPKDYTTKNTEQSGKAPFSYERDSSLSLFNFKVTNTSQEIKQLTEKFWDKDKYQIHRLCFQGNLAAVKATIENSSTDFNLNVKNKLGLTALDCAIEGKKSDIIKFILTDPRWNINSGGSNKRSSLNYAVQASNYSAAEDIINSHKSVNFNILDDSGNNVLHLLMDKLYYQKNNKVIELMKLIFSKLSVCHRHLFIQQNHDMYTPLHWAIRSKNKFGIVEFINLIKMNDFGIDEILKCPAGYDRLPIVHYFAIVLKAHETDYILERWKEIKLFERDHRGVIANLFEYNSNNNFDNFKRWALVKHQQRVFFERFQKPWRSYHKILKAEKDVAKIKWKTNVESEYHSYTAVLKNLRKINTKQMIQSKRLAYRRNLKSQKFCKIEQKQLCNDTQIYEDTIWDINLDIEACNNQVLDSEENESEETTAIGSGSGIHSLINNMKINPRKKAEIDVSHESKIKSENISTEDDPFLEDDVTTRKINFFTKSSSRKSEEKPRRVYTQYDLKATPRRHLCSDNTRIIYTPYLIDFADMLKIKRDTVLSHLSENTKKQKVNERKLTYLLSEVSEVQHIPTWQILIDIMTMSNINKDLLVHIKELSIKIKAKCKSEENILKS